MVPFDGPGDDPQAFANANTLDELRALETVGRMKSLARHCAESLQGYDPQALKMEDANAFIARLVVPLVADVESLPLRQCAGRVLAEDVVSPLSVPGT